MSYDKLSLFISNLAVFFFYQCLKRRGGKIQHTRDHFNTKKIILKINHYNFLTQISFNRQACTA